MQIFGCFYIIDFFLYFLIFLITPRGPVETRGEAGNGRGGWERGWGEFFLPGRDRGWGVRAGTGISPAKGLATDLL